MKRTLCALAAATLPALAGARDLQPGTFELGAATSLDYGSSRSELNGTQVGSDVSSLDLAADALFYPATDLGLGLRASYSRSDANSTVLSASALEVEGKYSLPVAPTASLLALGSVGRATRHFESPGLGPVDQAGLAWRLGGGVRFFPADFLSLDATFEYSSASLDDDAGGTLDVTGWDVLLGFSFYLGGR